MSPSYLADLLRQHKEWQRKPDPHNRHPGAAAAMRMLRNRRARRRFRQFVRRFV